MDKKKIVLAIDDDSVQLTLFKGILFPKYDFRAVNSASGALHYLNNDIADVILLDINMPNISGFEFLGDIRKIPSYVTIPIIIVSGIAGEEFLTEAKNSSASDVLLKPVSKDVLLSTIEKALAIKD